MPRFAAVLFAFVFVAPVLGQGAQDGSAKQGVAPTLRTGTKLVVVDVAVTDARHNPVHGLTADDFALRENKKAQAIKSFEEHTAPSAAALQAVPPMPKMPTGVFTNLTPALADGPVNVLLIDRLNTPMESQTRLRAQLMDYLAKAKPGQRIATF